MSVEHWRLTDLKMLQALTQQEPSPASVNQNGKEEGRGRGRGILRKKLVNLRDSQSVSSSCSHKRGMDWSALRINTQMLAVASCTRWRGLRPSVARVQILWPCVRTQGLQAAPRQRRRRWRHNDTETQIAKGIAKTQIAKVSVQNQFSVFFLYKHTLCGEKYIWYN